jgi:hypothetical protein
VGDEPAEEVGRKPRGIITEDAEKSQRVMRAMMQMTKLDIAGLQRAYDSTGEHR